jgi:cystathionine gamma-synthase
MSDTDKPKLSIETLAPRSGDIDIKSPGRPTAMPLFQTTVYSFESIEELEELFTGEQKGWFYYRVGGPNQSAFEEAFAALEKTEAALAASSGMAAISAGIMCVVSAGDHILADKVIYGTTYTLLSGLLPRFGVETSFVDTTNPAEIRAAMRPNTKLLYFETINNPLIGVSDVAALGKLAKELGLVSMVDSTFTTPYLIRPVELGADMVVHATTKYTCGHSDAMGGVLAGSTALIAKAREFAMVMGMTPSPFDAWMNLRSLKTLALRMAAHSHNGQIVAEWLAEQPQVSVVNYPSLKTHPQHTLALQQYPRGFGGMLSFELKNGSLEKTKKFVKALEGIPFVPSLADVTTSISYPAGTSHRAFPPEERAKIGVTDGLLRLSVGIEDPSDIIAELDNALKQL